MNEREGQSSCFKFIAAPFSLLGLSLFFIFISSSVVCFHILLFLQNIYNYPLLFHPRFPAPPYSAVLA